MIELYIDDNWAKLTKDVYVLTRAQDGVHIYGPTGEIDYIATPGTDFRDSVEPTFRIRNEWLPELLSALAP